jgi:hypothetical protein
MVTGTFGFFKVVINGRRAPREPASCGSCAGPEGLWNRQFQAEQPDDGAQRSLGLPSGPAHCQTRHVSMTMFE